MNAELLTRNQMKAICVHELIRRYRNEGCYTQEYLANELGITQSTYQRIETGEINITLERLMQIAKVLNKPIDAFLDRKHLPISDDNDSIVHIGQRELNLLHKMLEQQNKRIEELESKLLRRNLKIEELKNIISNGRQA